MLLQVEMGGQKINSGSWDLAGTDQKDVVNK